MTLILIALAFLATLELSLWLPKCWPARKLFGRALAYSNMPVSIVLLLVHPTIWSTMFVLISAYRMVNLLRLSADRTHPDHMYHVSRRTSVVLCSSQVVLLILVAIGSAMTVIQPLYWVYLVAVVTLLIAIAGAAYFWRQLRTSLPPVFDAAPNNLPSVSVLVPARNETEDLEECLQSLVASTYKKLEIIVLDDCSQNQRTPEIIKSFAHDGVLFIAGEAPPEHWLAKNYAYERLSRESNGEILLFCGVDTRFKPETIGLMVQAMVEKQKSMVSVVPRNVLPHDEQLLSWLVQTGRYAWEFLLPRRYIGRPAVLSTCWLITRQSLQAAGGFAAYKQSVLPERHLAKRTTQQGDGYSFMRASAVMGLTSSKSYDEQQATAVRTRYPLLHKRPETVLAYTVGAALFCVWPAIVLLVAAVHRNLPLLIISSLHCLILAVVGYQLTTLTYRRPLLRGVFALPLLVLYDITITNYSMWQYEFHEVLWKGRNICLPVMHVIPRLPKID